MGYPQIALDSIKYYSSYFNGMRVVLSGDFNCFVGQSDESPKRGTLLQIVDFLSRHNRYSLYHKQTKEDFGKESRTTYHWQFREEQQFFLDYTFTNIEDVKYQLVEWNSKFSDHQAQTFEIEKENACRLVSISCKWGCEKNRGCSTILTSPSGTVLCMTPRILQPLRVFRRQQGCRLARRPRGQGQ